jgi:hypothetical protein
LSRTNIRALPPAKYLHGLLSYDAQTGKLIWISTGRRVPVGTEAGWVGHHGRRYLEIDGISYFAHRIIWKMMTGRDPNPEIDHINLIRDDNRWANLREASWSENAQNRAKRRDSKNKYKGIRCDKRSGKWCARIQSKSGKRLEFGWFASPEEAYAIYCAEATKHFGEFARLS